MLKNVRLTVSSLTGNVYIAQYNPKRPDKPISKLEISEGDLMAALVGHELINEFENGMEKDFTLNNKKYYLKLAPKEE